MATPDRAEHPGDAPTRELSVAPSSGDRCGACGAPLAHDQRYCVECGERRGQSRFPAAAPATEARVPRRTRERPAQRPLRVGSGTTLVAGVGVLLLAIGLGVLIGRVGNNATTTKASAPPQVITVQGGAAAGTPTTTTPTTAATGTKAKAKPAAATKAPPPAVQKKATQAASKVLGSSAHLAPPTVHNGQTCTGAGCQGGKFTGNFFGQ